MTRFYYILILATLAICTACSVDEKFGADRDEDKTSVEFATDITPISTKASVSTSDSLKQSGKTFNVSSYYKVNTTDMINYFDATVSYNGASWVSNNPQFWPNSGSLIFDAYTPTSVNGGEIVNVNSNKKVDHSLKYVCPSSIDNQIDLLVKRVEVGNKSTADINFEHALSKIGFTVEFDDEKNIVLDSINITYRDIECEKVYSFESGAWIEPATPTVYGANNTSTKINVNKQLTVINDNVKFNVDTCVIMIIPQSINLQSGKYISVSISYHIAYATGEPSTPLTTGYMPLPPPDGDDDYEKGKGYTYNLIVNGETIRYGGLNIVEPEDPSPAYGNIDLSLITKESNYSEVNNAPAVPESEANTMYYTTALRVENLLDNGVRDFVVVGSLGADDVSKLGNGKLGYYGLGSSPFNLGANAAELDQSEANLFSVDLRGTSDFPMFKNAHDGDIADGDGGVIDGNSRIVPPGLFMGVIGLKEVILPRGLSAVGSHAFADCDALQVIDISDALHIEMGGFQHCNTLTTVIGDKLTRIHANGFDDCAALVNINLENVKEIDEYGFVSCSSLNNVNLSELTSIGRHAFDGCTELTLQSGTTIPYFTEVAEYAFSGCTKLGSSGAKLILDKAEVVGDYAFNRCNSITFSTIELTNLDTIGNSAFKQCWAIGEIQLPDIDSIGEGAFLGCENLRITDSAIENINTLNDYTFQHCTSLDNYFTFNNITEVGKYAFSGCTSLRGITMDNLDSIGGDFISGCTSLESVSLKKLVKNTHEWFDYEIDDNGDSIPSEMKDCSVFGMLISAQNSLISLNMESVTDPQPDYYPTFEDFVKLESAILTNIPSVGGKGFYNCTSLVNIDITNAESIGDRAFYNCTSLKSIAIPNATTIKNNAFQNCTLLSSVDMPNVTTIESDAFNNCNQLKDIDFTNVESVGSSAFYDNSLLESIYMPIAKSIGNLAFSNCATLKSINAPEVTSVGNKAFELCSAITEVKMNSVTSPSEDFLADCNKLVTIELASINSTIWNGDYSSYNAVIAQSKNTLERLVLSSVTNNPYWGDFLDYPKLTYVDFSSITEASSAMFQGCTNLTEAKLSSVVTCKSTLFNSCTNLSKVDLKSLTKITGKWVFAGCESLTELDLSSLGLENSYDDDNGTAVTTTNIMDLELFSWGWDGSGCTLTLSAAQYDANVTGGNTWAGITWGNIIRAE